MLACTPPVVAFDDNQEDWDLSSGEGVHTVAFAVDGQARTIERLDASGVRTIGGAFVHPGAAHGLLVQLSER